jgi:ATP/maltotriose-dependent transcriptional regulator MalT/two-component SAPR family response regulator
LLDLSRQYPLVWVTGPAGAGKTTLVASYLDTREFPCIWYQIDEGEGDPATFFYYLSLAAKIAAPRIKRPLPLLTPEYAFGIHTFAKRYFESLFARLKRPSVIVLDNYQTIRQDSLLHDIIAHGLTVIPNDIQVIMISRNELPSPFVRFQANSQMMLIDREQLRLTPEELMEIMRLRCANEPSLEAVRCVSEKTRGWAAGVVLLCQAARMGILDPELIRAPLSEKVIDYFSNELFEKADIEIQNFLLKTAFPSYLTPGVAGELTGHANADQILSRLNGRNFFIEKRTHPELTYQYHPLFREFLLARVHKSFTPDDISRLQCNSARLLEQNNHVEEAAALYQEAGEWEGLLNLILQHAPTLIMQGRNKTVEDWILSLPDTVVARSPWTFYWRGMCQAPFHPTTAKLNFEKAFYQFEKASDAAGSFLSCSEMINAILYEWDSCIPLDAWITTLQKLMRRTSISLPDEVQARVTLQMFTALLLRRPHDRELPAWEQKLCGVWSKTDDMNLKAMIGSIRVLSSIWFGDFAQGGDIVHELRSAIHNPSVTPSTRISWYTMESAYFWVRGEYGPARNLINDCLQEAEHSGIHNLDLKVLAQGAYNAMTFGNIAEAGHYLDHMATILGTSRRLDTLQYFYGGAVHALAKGDFSKALECGRKAAKLCIETGAPFPTAIVQSGLAFVFFECGERRDAMAYLSSAYSISRKTKSKWLYHGCLLLRAYFSFARGAEEEGKKYLRKAMTLGKEQGYINAVCFLPALLIKLCMKALEYGIAVAYVTEMIRKRKLIPDDPPYYLESWPWPIKIYSLGRFSLIENDKPRRFAGKAQKKPLDMLKAMVALGGRDISEQKIIDTLWPDATYNGGRSMFKTTLHRLRKLMTNCSAIVLQEGRLALDNRQCWVDAWAFERFLGEADKMWSQEQRRKGVHKITEKQKEAVRLTEKAVAMYKGNFLETDSNEPWTIFLREHLRMRYIRAVGRLGSYWEEAGELEKAADCYESGLRVNDLTEEFYQYLMSCHCRLGRKAEAIKTYQHCCSVLKANLGIEPSPETIAIYRTLMQ